MLNSKKTPEDSLRIACGKTNPRSGKLAEKLRLIPSPKSAAIFIPLPSHSRLHSLRGYFSTRATSVEGSFCTVSTVSTITITLYKIREEQI